LRTGFDELVRSIEIQTDFEDSGDVDSDAVGRRFRDGDGAHRQAHRTVAFPEEDVASRRVARVIPQHLEDGALAGVQRGRVAVGAQPGEGGVPVPLVIERSPVAAAPDHVGEGKLGRPVTDPARFVPT
jgi:hypothetical protein